MSSDELIASIEAAVEAAPRDVALRAHLISLLLDAGRERDAVPHVWAGLDLDPEHVELLEMSVRVLEALGDPKAAPMRDQLDGESDRDPAGGSRRVTPEGYSADDFPDTVDELVEEWEGSAPIEEVDVGHLSAAGIAAEIFLERSHALRHSRFRNAQFETGLRQARVLGCRPKAAQRLQIHDVVSIAGHSSSSTAIPLHPAV